jgi:hypothetical protein
VSLTAPIRRRSGPFAVALLATLAFLSGCASREPDDTEGGAANALTTQHTDDAVLYFHGMSHLGLEPDEIKKVVGTEDLLAPTMSDSELQSEPSKTVLDFLKGHVEATVSGYSLGRVVVFRMMKSHADAMTRVVMIDPTFDSAAGLGQKIGGPTVKAWLDGDPKRSFMLVYGDATKQLSGQDSYEESLRDNPQAEICFFPGDHARFRAPDMASALIAKGCEDLANSLE